MVWRGWARKVRKNSWSQFCCQSHLVVARSVWHPLKVTSPLAQGNLRFANMSTPIYISSTAPNVHAVQFFSILFNDFHFIHSFILSLFHSFIHCIRFILFIFFIFSFFHFSFFHSIILHSFITLSLFYSLSLSLFHSVTLSCFYFSLRHSFILSLLHIVILSLLHSFTLSLFSLFHCCFNVVLLMFLCGFINVSLLFHCCFIVVSLLLHCCLIFCQFRHFCNVLTSFCEFCHMLVMFLVSFWFCHVGSFL